MSSLNVAEWSVDQVADWLSGAFRDSGDVVVVWSRWVTSHVVCVGVAGLGPTVARYVPTLRERGLDGAKLLALRCDDLEYLGMNIIGHQELVLEAVEHLRNFVSYRFPAT